MSHSKESSVAASDPAWIRRAQREIKIQDGDQEMKYEEEIASSSSSHKVGKPLRLMVLDVGSSGSFLHLYGVTELGETVRVRVSGFNPYVYAKVSVNMSGGVKPREIEEADLPELRALLEEELQSSRAAKQLAKASAATAAAASTSAAASASAATPKPKAGGKASTAAATKKPSPAAAGGFFGKKAAAASSSRKAMDDDDEGDEGEGDDGGDEEEGEDFIEEEESEEELKRKGANVVSIALVSKRSIMFYRGDELERFVRFELSSPTLCTPAHQIFTKNSAKLNVKGQATPAAAASSKASTVKAKAPEPATVACLACTFINLRSNSKCSVCETPIPAYVTAPEVIDINDDDEELKDAITSTPSASGITSFSFGHEAFGTNIEHYLRFMVDAEIGGGGWVEVYNYESIDEPAKKQTKCKHELLCKWHSFRALDVQPLRGVQTSMHSLSSATIAPLRTLSFDIQMDIRQDDVTPDAQVDPIVSIANTVWWMGSGSEARKETPVKVLFIVQSSVATAILKDVNPNFRVVFCANEADLLLQWREFFLQIDPDIVTGYDIAERDLPYILTRVEKYVKSGGGAVSASADRLHSPTPTAGKRAKKSPAASASPASSSAFSGSTLPLGTRADFSNWNQLGRDGLIVSSLQNIQTYTAGWVKSKRRMTATSNQASAYFKMEGRLFFDVQRIIQTTYSLRSYSLQECCEEFLKKTEELLDENSLTALLRQTRQPMLPIPTPVSSSSASAAASSSSNARGLKNALDESAKPVALSKSLSNSSGGLKRKPTAADRKRKLIEYEIESATPPPVADMEDELPAASSPSSLSLPPIEVPLLPFNSPSQCFQRFASYCVRQSELPLLLMHEMMILVSSMELARTTGINVRDVHTRGQMIRTWSLLLRYCNQAGVDYLLPSQRDNSQSQTMTSGPYIFDCIAANTTGLYNDPVATLDFASLYPSIMIGYNLCYSTMLVRKDESVLVPDENTFLTPIQRRFVKPSVRKGAIPIILEYLLDARKKVKKLMNESTDTYVKAILNERQKALKISANATYGFTGSSASKLLLVELAESTINYGAKLLQQSATWVEERFGFDSVTGAKQCEVIYGDTDSLMIRMHGKSIAQAMDLAQQISKSITASHQHPIQFAYEKVYCPFLLQQNKKYAGVKYTNSAEKYDELDVKGMESVRRDIIMLVRDLIQEILQCILIEKNLEKALSITKRTIYQLLNNQYSLYELVVTKALWRGTDSSGYGGAKLAHIEFAEKLKKRFPNRSIVIGQRVSYVFTQGEKGSKQYDKTEDPLYVDAHQLSLDLDLYVQNYVAKPIIRLFCLKGLLGTVEKANKVLLTGEHMRSVKKVGPSAETGLGAFFKAEASARCSHCKRPISNSGGAAAAPGKGLSPFKKAAPVFTLAGKMGFGKATTGAAAASNSAAASSSSAKTAASKPKLPNHGLCDDCYANRSKVMLSRVAEYTARETQMATLAVQCHRCQGAFSQEILCVNQDCKVFWERRKTWKTVNEAHQLLLQLDW